MFFSEKEGGSASSSVILGGVPLALHLENWTTFNFITKTGYDVSSGVSTDAVTLSSVKTLFR